MKINDETIYSERYNEMRRFRDYELTVSTWYSAILLAILGSIASEKFNQKSLLFIHLNSNLTYQVFIASAVVIIGLCFVYSLCYVSFRYQELRTYMTEFIEPNELPYKFKPYETYLKPRDAIFITYVILIGMTNFILLAPPVINGAISLACSTVVLFTLYVHFRCLEEKRVKEIKEESDKHKQNGKRTGKKK